MASFDLPSEYLLIMELRFEVMYSGTDLRISQIGHGLGTRAFGGPVQLVPMTTHY